MDQKREKLALADGNRKDSRESGIKERSGRESPMRSRGCQWDLHAVQLGVSTPHLFLYSSLQFLSFILGSPSFSWHTGVSESLCTPSGNDSATVSLLPFICLCLPWAPGPDSTFHHSCFVARMVSILTSESTGTVWGTLASKQ